jgi:predicted nuclease of restriction endonuclease-like (RecB) superfamily
MDFKVLVENIKATSSTLNKSVTKAVNVYLTIRNLLVGFYIVEFEQDGKDRAEYGKKLLQNLAKEINIKGLTAPELSRCRQFYKVYSPILGSVTQRLKNEQNSTLSIAAHELESLPMQILGTPSQELQTNDNEQYISHYKELFLTTSYSNLTELIKIEDAVKRNFYELLIIKTRPSVKELKRQINSLAYERLGLSKDKDLAFEQLKKKIEPATTTDLVKSHYFFEFLGINKPELIEEDELEQALISNLQEFILELGNGFCLEARQKRIMIGDEYFWADLVFYHRILKCHVIIELKTNKAKHEHIGQLKSYIQHYKRNVMQKDDNPPVGILLVTDKNDTLVEYAIADDDKELFVSKYALQLPKKEALEAFIINELKSK